MSKNPNLTQGQAEELSDLVFRVARSATFMVTVTIVGLLVLATSLYIGNYIIENDLQEQKDNQYIGDAHMEILSHSLQMRRSEKDFLLRKDRKFIERYNDLAIKALVALRELRDYPAAKPMHKSLNLLHTNIQRHMQQFNLVTLGLTHLGLDEKSGLRGTMLASAAEAERTVNKKCFTKLYLRLLMMRRHEKNFVIRQNSKYVGEVAKNYREFEGILNTKKLKPADKDHIFEIVTNYYYNFNKFADSTRKLQPAIKKLTTIYHDFSLVMNHNLDFLAHKSVSSRLQAINDFSNFKTFISLILLAIALGAGILGILLVRYCAQFTRK